MIRTLLFAAMLSANLGAASPWPQGKTFAVSLTHDDGLESQILNAAFALDQRGLKASFYPTGNSKSVAANPAAWSALIAKGHELGSHSMIHPCGGGSGSFLAPQDRLEAYTPERLADELDQSVRFLAGLGWKRAVTYAWPCGQSWVGKDQQDITELAAERFTAARDAWGGVADPATVKLMHVPAVDGAKSLVSLKSWVDEARKKGGWLVFMFHGVGGDYLSVDMDAYQGLLDILAADPQAWVAPFGTVAERVKALQEKP